MTDITIKKGDFFEAKRLFWQGVGVGLFLILCSLWFKNWLMTTSVAVGVAMALANFWLLSRIIMQFLSEKPHFGAIVLRFLIKLAILSLLFWWFLTEKQAHPLGFLVGISSIVVPIIWSGLGGLRARV